jgi:hypothetical protein
MMRSLILALAALTLASCASVQKLDAANDVHSLLVSIRDDDPATFDAYVDRPALKREIEARLVTEAGKDKRLSGVAAFLAPTLASMAGDALIQPRVFRAVADHYGYKPTTKVPGPLAISQALRPLPDGRMCAISKKDGPCLMDFTKGPDGRWKLSGFEGELSMLRLKL